MPATRASLPTLFTYTTSYGILTFERPLPFKNFFVYYTFYLTRGRMAPYNLESSGRRCGSAPAGPCER